MTKICVSIPPKSIDEIIKLIRKAEEKNADFIEVRLDTLKNYKNLEDVCNFTETPLIATNKSIKYHGHFSGTETERQEILLDAARNGFEFVDIDLGLPNQLELIRDLKEEGTKIIISYHDFEKTNTKNELDKILTDQISSGADVCKLITTARTIEDNLLILNFISEASKKCKLVCFAMGEKGKVSRVLSPFFGCFFTFAALDKKRKTAKGQLTIKEMNFIFELLG